VIRALAIAASLGCLVMSGPALACRCNEPSAADAVASSAMAIFGKVATIRKVGPNAFDYEVIAERAWGQARPGTVVVRSQGMCQYEMEKDAKYLLFLRRTSPGILQTSVCMGNQPEAEMAATVSLLEGRYRTLEHMPANGAHAPCG